MSSINSIFLFYWCKGNALYGFGFKVFGCTFGGFEHKIIPVGKTFSLKSWKFMPKEENLVPRSFQLILRRAAFVSPKGCICFS